MDSEPQSSLLSDVTDAVIDLPEAVKKPFYKAIADLLDGLVAIPTAKFNQITQSINDTTSARKLVSEAMAKVTVERVSHDPELSSLAADIYMPTILRKAKNRVEVAKNAAIHLPSYAARQEPDKAASPDDDWMNRFMRFAEDASSERMQDLFGRILAGEVSRPGAFGLSTLRTLSELDQDIAEDFTYAWSLSVGEAVDFTNEWRKGDGYSRWKRLVEAGLMASSAAEQSPPPFQPLKPPRNDISLWQPVTADNSWLIIAFTANCNAVWEHIDFTRVGRQIGSILERPNYEHNMRQMADRLRRVGTVQAELITNGAQVDVIWQNLDTTIL